eukprot:3546106-Amphidinium_carterae.1
MKARTKRRLHTASPELVLVVRRRVTTEWTSGAPTMPNLLLRVTRPTATHVELHCITVCGCKAC